MRVALLLLCFMLAGCEVATTGPPTQQPRPSADGRPDARTAAFNFVTVVRRVEPVAEQVCRERTRGINCDYLVVIDDRPRQPPNAFHTLDRSGRPVIGFTIALIADARNQDELAFILGHEAAHYIEGHIARGQQAAVAGAVVAGALAELGGGDAAAIRSAQDLGSQLGVRSFAKGFEIEADELGTRIAMRAGYDPIRGAAYFTRIPDPGNRFLGTHPPNSDRLAAVRRAAGR